MRKLICYAEFEIGEKATEKEIQRLIDKGFDHALFMLSDGIDIKLDNDSISVRNCIEVDNH